jgi:hypothetical protein
MSKVAQIFTGMGMLILLYLVLNNWAGSVGVISALGNVTVNGVKTLQGR